MKPDHLFALAVLATVSCVVQAADGHDHGDTPAAANEPSLPRFNAVSEAFELVGVLSGKQLTLYLDRYADNAPVPDARIELDIAGVKWLARKHGDAVYEVVLEHPPAEGVLPITATVTAGNETDLLAGELDIHAASEARVVAPASGWNRWVGWAAGGLAAFIVLVLAGRRMVASRRTAALRSGGAA